MLSVPLFLALEHVLYMHSSRKREEEEENQSEKEKWRMPSWSPLHDSLCVLKLRMCISLTWTWL